MDYECLLFYCDWFGSDLRAGHFFSFRCPLVNTPQLNTQLLNSLRSLESEPCVTTDGKSASLSWNKAPIWGLRPEFCYCQTVTGLLIWGALSDERTGLSFTIADGPYQRSHSRARVPWYSWPYFTVYNSRLPISSPPTTRRATVEVLDPASTRDRPPDHHLKQFLCYILCLSVATKRA
jgi:hypothetical protein